MELEDARRLTGPNLLTEGPLVIVELAFGPDEPLERALAAYSAELARMLTALGLPPPASTVVRRYTGVVVVGYEAPLDEMLAHTEASEWAALSVCEIVKGAAPLELEPKRTLIAEMLLTERSPHLVALASEARARGVPFLWDDAFVSVGMGVHSRTYPRGDVPPVAEVPWTQLAAIPVALVTGTNGKTTSTRLLARMAQEAGLVVGTTSSDGVSVAGEIVEKGDWTGPAAARLVLRRREVEAAVLETARGGILRRGLAVDHCDVALVTNVSDDHLGGYGISDLTAMAEVKGVVASVVKPSGVVVLGAHVPELAALAERLAPQPRKLTFFADLDRGDARAAEVIRAHRAAGGAAVVCEGGEVLVCDGQEATRLASAASIPITFGGVARYNVENVLGAVAAARGLGLPDSAVARALERFGGADNPGRAEIITRFGARVVLDFAHNPDGIRALMQLVSSLRAASPGRLTIIAGSAGDRGDREIEAMAGAIAAARPDRVLARDLAGYMRGRTPGEVPEIFRRVLVAGGLPASAFGVASSEVEALRTALADAREGDLVVVLVHLDRAEVRELLTGSP
jgi:cyanophycin synthetase